MECSPARRATEPLWTATGLPHTELLVTPRAGWNAAHCKLGNAATLKA
jgi:hypothetical protein